MITDQEYRGSKRINQSSLKKILLHPQDYLASLEGDDELDEPAEALTIGSGVDILLTQSEDAFYKEYFVSSVERPTAQMGEYVWHLFAYRKHPAAEQLAYDTVGFKRDTLVKVKERFLVEGKPYYDELVASEGKVVITPTQFNTIQLIKRSLEENPFTKHYFVKSDRYLITYQIPLLFTIDEIDCKGLMDVLVYDRLENTLTPLDLKTTTKSINFWKPTFFKSRYDFQAAFYLEGLKQTDLTQFCEGNTPTLKPFKFVVESQKFPGKPLIYELSEEVIKIGREGGTYDGYSYEGYLNAIHRLKWHTANDQWDYTMEDYYNQGVRVI